MDLCLVMVFLVHIGLLAFAKWAKKNLWVYDTRNCRDVRASLGLFAYKSDVEEKKQTLKRSNSKF